VDKVDNIDEGRLKQESNVVKRGLGRGCSETIFRKGFLRYLYIGEVPWLVFELALLPP